MNLLITHEPNCDRNVWEHTHKILKLVPVFFSGCETGDVGRGSDKTDEPPEQHRRQSG